MMIIYVDLNNERGQNLKVIILKGNWLVIIVYIQLKSGGFFHLVGKKR